MPQHFSRQEILRNLSSKTSEKSPIIAVSAGIGLISKIADAAKADLIITTHSDYYRMDGHPSAMGYFAYSNANTLTLANGKKILKMAKNVPVIVGIGSGDPYREIDELADEYWDMGFSGYINSPAAGMYGSYMEHHLAGTPLGVNADASLIKAMREKDRLTIALAITTEQAKIFADSGADIVIAFAGYTVGGLKGAPADMSLNLDETCAYVQEVYDIVKKGNPDAFVLCHGAQLNSPPNVQTCFHQTDVDGFYGASALDRLPIERAIHNCVSSFKKLHLQNI